MLSLLGLYAVFFMQATRFSPKEASVEMLIDNLIYVMNCMLEDEFKGIGFILDLSDCSMHHFSVGYFLKLMIAIQGRKNPTRIEMFLIVNQPTWFANMWGAVIKPMLHKDFREKTHRINFNDMKKFLAPEFERFLPSDIYGGNANSDLMVRRFIEERKMLEVNRFD
jgi:CRAL/TRIO domain